MRRIRRLLILSGWPGSCTPCRPTSQDQVLEVATGPGYVAMGFAAVAREVVGVDLTAAPLAIAEQRRQEQGLHNVRFQLADASRSAICGRRV